MTQIVIVKFGNILVTFKIYSCIISVCGVMGREIEFHQGIEW
jgi:hypothetical protein